MVDNPIRIVVTGATPHENEAERLTTLLEGGWSYIHLRYPHLLLREVRTIIERIPQKYHKRLKLHGHFELVNEFNLGGLHLNSRCPVAPPRYSGDLSLTCHSVEEVAEAAKSGAYSYVTLSPVFSSISKPGYISTLSNEDMEKAAQLMPVIALGGIAPHKLPDLTFIPFAGYAALGYIESVSNPEELKLITNDYFRFHK